MSSDTSPGVVITLSLGMDGHCLDEHWEAISPQTSFTPSTTSSHLVHMDFGAW